jgi:hypothetical protein
MSYGYPQQQQAWPTYGYGNAYVARQSAPVSVHLVAIVQYLYGLATLAVAGLAGYVAWRQADLGFADRYFDDVARNMLIAVAVVFAARKTIAERDPTAAPYALCGTATAVCFLVLATLFDELGYPHGAYIFLYIAGLVVVVVGPRAAPEARASEPREHPLRTRYARPRPVVGVVRQRMIRTR